MTVKMTAGSGSGVGRMQKAENAKSAAPSNHIHHPTKHADGHKTGHKKIKRFMKEPFHNEDAE